MLKRTFLAALLISTPLAAHAVQMPPLTPYAQMPAGNYAIDPTHASVTWRVNHLGLSTYTARFTKVDATLNFDPKEPAKSTLKASIDPTSIKTDYPNPEKENFDAKLSTGAEWFNSGKFPKITFESTRIEKTGDTTGVIYGNMTMLGVTKPVALNTTFNGAYANMPMLNKPALGFSATTTIKRSDWGLSGGIPAVGDEVNVLIEAEFHKAP